MATSKNEEVAALEALRDSSADLVRYLDAMNDKLAQLNQQNERTPFAFLVRAEKEPCASCSLLDVSEFLSMLHCALLVCMQSRCACWRTGRA